MDSRPDAPRGDEDACGARPARPARSSMPFEFLAFAPDCAPAPEVLRFPQMIIAVSARPRADYAQPRTSHFHAKMLGCVGYRRRRATGRMKKSRNGAPRRKRVSKMLLPFLIQPDILVPLCSPRVYTAQRREGFRPSVRPSLGDAEESQLPFTPPMWRRSPAGRRCSGRQPRFTREVTDGRECATPSAQGEASPSRRGEYRSAFRCHTSIVPAGNCSMPRRPRLRRRRRARAAYDISVIERSLTRHTLPPYQPRCRYQRLQQLPIFQCVPALGGRTPRYFPRRLAAFPRTM